jgi:ketosteroid isomerase-like protein
MPTSPHPDAPAVVTRLCRAWNDHDLEALVACFHPDYESLQPLHPDRQLRGAQSVRFSWGEIFRAVPDLQTELIRCTLAGDLAWTEWRWRGAYVDGNAFDAGGVMIFGLEADRIRWARVYTETVQIVGPDFDFILDEIVRRESTTRSSQARKR